MFNEGNLWEQLIWRLDYKESSRCWWCFINAFANRYGRYNTVRQLVESCNGYLILNECNDEGKTALHIASEEGEDTHIHKHIYEPRVIQILFLEFSYFTIFFFHLFIYSFIFYLIISFWLSLSPTHFLLLGHTRVVQLLLGKGALLHRDHQGRTPLHLAAEGGHLATLTAILTVHAHTLDQTDKEGVSYGWWGVAGVMGVAFVIGCFSADRVWLRWWD